MPIHVPTRSMTSTVPVTISVGVGMDFTVPREAYDEAVRMAVLWRKVMFVGLMATGRTMISSSRDYLFERGCQSVAWITPMDGGL